MKNNILPLLLILFIPIIYFYDELLATLSTSLIACGYAIYSLFYKNIKSFLPTKILVIISTLIFTWLFTVERSVWISYSHYSSWPVSIKLYSLILISFATSINCAFTSISYISFYKIAAITGFLHGLLAINEYIEAPPIPKTWLDPASKELFRTRCSGILTDPNIFAAFLSVLFIMTIPLILNAKKQSERIFASASLTICGIGIMTTLSRGGWIALGAGLIPVFIYLFKNRKQIDNSSLKLTAVCFCILIPVFLVGPFKYRFFSITKPTDMTFFQRTLINRGIMGAINKLPIAGHGLHTFNQIYPLYRIVGGDYPMNAHNEYLHSMLETGFLSSILLIIISLYLLRIAFKSITTNNLNTIIFSSAFISLLIQNQSGFSARILPTSLLIAISVGGILSSQLIYTNKKHSANVVCNIKIFDCLIIILILTVLINSPRIYLRQNKLITANNYSDKPELAIKEYQEILTNEPDNPEAAFKLANIYIAQKQNEKAINTLTMAFNENKTEAIFPMALAQLYSKNNNELANYYYLKALELDPASENYRLEYTKYLLSLNKKTEAKSVLEKGLSYSPGFHNVYVGFYEMEQLLQYINNIK